MNKLLVMSATTLAVLMSLKAETEMIGGYTWTYRINGDTAEISGVSPSPGTVTIPSTLGGKPVTSIGSSAFYNCSVLTSVTIPGSVTSIRDFAFYGCSMLINVTIPNSVTSIGEGAFYGCSGLTNMIFNGNAPTVGNSAFFGVENGCVAYVRKGSIGWGVDIPGIWNGINIRYLTPEVQTNKTYEIDFATLYGQPFSDIDMSGDLTLMQVAMATGAPCVKHMYERGILGVADVFTLYDYLDHNDVPLSLAMPCVECVPMVTAVELVGNNLASLKVNPPAMPVVETPSQPGPGVQTTTTQYQLDPSSFVSGAAGVRVLVSFPFRHFRGRNIDDFKVQVAMKVFVASGDVSVRPANGLQDLRPKDKAEWNGQSKAFTVDGNAPGNALAWSLYSQKVNVTIPNECKTQDDAVMKVDVTSWNGAADVPGGQAFFTTIKEQPGTVSATGGFTPSGQATYSHQFDLRPYRNGILLDDGKIQGDITTAPYANEKFGVYAMLWVRITDSSGEVTYDLAPAVVADDMLNNRDNQAMYGQFFGASDSSALLFAADQSTSYTYADIVAGTLTGVDGVDRNWQPKALAAVDPRYNYAAEDWFTWNETAVDGVKWLDAIANAGFFNVSENRDPDVFMFTSNQGYLQSLGEFAFLPRLSQWNSQPGSRISTILKNAPGASPGAAHAATPQAILNNACAWRTYPVDHEFYEDCASVGIGRSSVLTVNPFSDNGHILLSAFANTPCDYWTTGRIVAGARNEELADGLAAIVDKMGDKNQTSGDRIDAGDSQKHMFCEYSYESSSRMTAAELDSIIRYVTSFTHTGDGVGSWEETYDNLFGVQMAVLNPNDDNAAKDFMGQTLNSCPLFSVDRKFLYAYWYDSMVANQNNLLLFARGEYSMPVTDIGEYAFCGCALITSVPIPNSVTNIAANAFWDCNKLTSIIFNGNAPTASTLAFSGVAPDCTAYIKKNSTGWGVDIPGMWKGLNVRYVPSEDEILEAVVAANERGTGYVTVVGDLPYVDVASGVTLKVLAPEQSAAALAEKLTAVPHEAGQSAALFKVEASTAADGVVSLTVGLDEYAVDPDAAAAEIVGAENMAVFSTAGDGEPVPVNLSSAKPGLYYGIAAANDIAGLAEAAETVPLVRAGPEGVTVPVTKPIGGAAFFKVVVSDRAR